MSTRSKVPDRTAERSRRCWTTRALAGLGALFLGAGVLPGLPAPSAQAADGQGFNLNASDLRFILNQIRIAERHVETATPTNPCGTLLGTGPDQIPNQNAQGAELPWGLRTVDGTCNNLKAGQEEFGAADRLFPRRATATFQSADTTPAGFPPGNGSPTSYDTPTGIVYDADPRLASNLIVDQTTGNPAAVAAAGEGAVPDDSGSLFIENVAPDEGLSAPFNSTFTLFGQFFDHGLDLVNKSGGAVFVPLQPDDPLVLGPDGQAGTADDLPPGRRFMVLTRAQNQPGPDGVLGTADDVQEATNQTSPYVDQSQTYTSHPSHQAFLREYTAATANAPAEATGRMLTGPQGGLATWESVKVQADDLLGIVLSDTVDLLNLPMLATDPYGNLLPGPNGHAQFVTATGLVEANPAAPVTPPADVVRSGHAFLDDIAHHAAPFGDNDANPGNAPGPRAPDGDSVISADDRNNATYDDELLDAHFMAGDGRINENIGLTAVHHVFHSEHNRLVTVIDDMITADSTLQAEWRPTGTAVQANDWSYTERLFQAARFVTEMQYQHLAFEEFARKVQPQVNVFAGYDTSIDAAITAEFAHAVYRFGHSMLTETVARRSAGGTQDDIPLLDAFLNPPAFYEGGRTPETATGDIIRGMTAQRGNEIDEFVTEALRNNLLGLPLDLATLNLARARETGVPPLNEARRQFHDLTGDSALAPYANWIDFGLGLRHENRSLVNFVAAYGTHPSITGTMQQRRAAATLLVSGQPAADGTQPPADAVDFMNGTGAYAGDLGGLNQVDLWVGGLAEKTSPFGGLLGSTFNFIFETQMEDLQDGDRFYYLTRTAGLNLLVQLEGNSFAELISRNSDAENLPADVFSSPDMVFDLSVQPATGAIVDDPATAVDERTVLVRMADGTIRFPGPEHVLFIGTPNVDRMRTGAGDDTLRGNELNDRIEGGAGNDQFVAGSGEDVLTDTFGDDTLKGGDGNDAMSSGPGFDLNQGGLGNDFVVGGSDPTETFGGPGNDMVFAGESSDTVFGDDGDDWIEGGGQADLLQGDNGAPFQDDPNTPGHDVINGNGGQDDYDAEGGDDVLVSGPGIERNEGMLGFDWVTHKNDPQPADDDLAITGLLPPSVDALRDRFDLVEAVSGGNFDDILRGDSVLAADAPGNELDAAGIARINGLAALLPAGATSFNAGNMILGGEGNDTIEGRGGDDIIHGDVWLNVQLQVPNASAPGGFRLYDSMMSRPVGSSTEPTLRDDVFAGRVDPGDVQIVRSIVQSAPGTFQDTAVFSGLQADYDVTTNADGSVTVVHARGAATDGTDTLFGIEELQFADTGGAVAPAAPTNVTAAVTGSGQVTVSFTAPTDDGGSPITQFEVDALLNGTVVSTVELLPTATSGVVTGLTPGTTYTFVVRAVNAVGETDSAPSGSVTAANAPDAPTIGTATAGNASATVRWTAPVNVGGSAITSYSIEVRTGTTVVRTVDNIAANATTANVANLTNGTAYNFRVRAVNVAGPGAFSAQSNVVTPTAATAPGTPAIGTATAGVQSATVRWTAPANGGSPITSYEVQVRTGTTPVRTVTGIPATATSTVISNLTAGTAYNFRVRAVNAVGQSAFSAASNTVTPTAPTVPAAPPTPTATAGVAGGAVNATVNWAAPANDGGSPITGYIIRWQRVSNTGTVLANGTVTAAATARSAVVPLPVSGANYRFAVRAVNAIGNGPFSANSNTVIGR